ncbi:MAG: hypothetical protein EAZ12_05575 [Sphingobacteriia bacterium]|nr:MAG: hypothetical protein EAZ12_05575 [Sphingobacteriia bacterium]
MGRFFILCIIFLNSISQSFAQTLGGNAVFSFLSQPNTAQLSALGGVNISAISNDVGMAFQNPSLLRNEMDQQINTSINAFFAGITQFSLTTAYHLAAPKINIGLGVQYLNYGTLTQTDAAGNILGNFRPNDYVVQVMVSKQFAEKFWLGSTAKFIQSNYGQYRAAGIAMDIGLSYFDEASQIQASVVAKNMGTQLSTYNINGVKEELPFDIQAGISKKLKNAPFQFSFTAHNLHRFNIYYNDTTFNNAEGITNSNGIQKVVGHMVLSVQAFLSDQLELNMGYNFQRRQDLNLYGTTSGLNGFTFGAGFLLRKLQIRYAMGFYQQHMFHQFSMNFNLKGNPLQ